MALNKDVLYFNSNFSSSSVKYPDDYPNIAKQYEELRGKDLHFVIEYPGKEWNLIILYGAIDLFHRLYLYIFYGTQSKKIVAFILRGRELNSSEYQAISSLLDNPSFRNGSKSLVGKWVNLKGIENLDFDKLLGIKKETQPSAPSKSEQPSTSIVPSLEEEEKKKKIELVIKLVAALIALSIIVFLMIKIGGKKK
jgi:hypothetical protein